MAFLSVSGITSTIFSRKLVIVSSMNMIPSRNTAVSANCHEYPITKQTVYAKNALSPMPGANANGSFAYSPIKMVGSADMRTVVVNNAPLSIPVSLRILGLTAKMYAMVRNVVIPAMTSVRIVVSFGLKPNSFLIMFSCIS